MGKLFHQYARKLTTFIIVILFFTSLWQLTTAGWIQGKAIIAQQLLNHSWNQTLNDRSLKQTNPAIPHHNLQKPWPWADTWPLAKMIIPKHDIEQIILAGDNGSSLAFAPGHSPASATLNTPGTAMISAHRDTHFKFLKNLKLNETIFIQTTENTIAYQVYDIQVVDSKTFKLQPANEEKILVLVTCYPFDSIVSGGSLRYLIFATAIARQNKVIPKEIQSN